MNCAVCQKEFEGKEVPMRDKGVGVSNIRTTPILETICDDCSMAMGEVSWGRGKKPPTVQLLDKALQKKIESLQAMRALLGRVE